MGAYNRINGEPCCASQLLLVDILRGEWGFRAMSSPTAGRSPTSTRRHDVTPDAGRERGAGPARPAATWDAAQRSTSWARRSSAGCSRRAISTGRSTRTFTTRFKLGMFDPQEQVPYASMPDERGRLRGTPRSWPTRRRSSRSSCSRTRTTSCRCATMRSMYVIGPTAANVEVLLGNYYGISETLTTLDRGRGGPPARGHAAGVSPGHAAAARAGQR